MIFDLSVLFPLLCAIALGSYIQTITGFAFGLVFISCVTTLNTLDLENATMISCLLALINTVVALGRRERHSLKKQVLIILLFALPFVYIGYKVLTFLDANHISLIKYILSTVIILASLLLLAPPKPGRDVSAAPVFAFFGSLAGLLGGLFATSGPPLIFQFYRQNLPVTQIRDSLLMIFAVLSTARLIIGISLDGIQPIVWTTALCGIPVTFIFTVLAKNYPPKMNDLTLRRLAACLLILAACNIALQA